MLAVTLAVTLTALPSAAVAQNGPPPAARALAQGLRDEKTSSTYVAALAATGDEDLAPLFVTLRKDDRPEIRTFAMQFLVEHLEKEAAQHLRPLLADPVARVRFAALAHLLDLEAATDEDLAAVASSDDPHLRLLRARALVERDRADEARETLRGLTKSLDPTVALRARLSLLSAGDASQLAELKKVVADAATRPGVLEMLLKQIAHAKIAPAEPLARAVIVGRRHPRLTVLAWRTLLDLEPASAAQLAAAIGRNPSTVARVNMLRALAEAPDASRHMAKLAEGDGAVAALARFERARAAGGEPAARAAVAAAKLGHPVVIDYLISQARTDIEDSEREADIYTPALLAYVEGVRRRSRRIRPEHERAARAAWLLGDIGSPEALSGLKAIIDAGYDARMRAVVGGLLKCENPKVAGLVEDLLNSPYAEIATNAAIILGRFGRKAAAGPLRRIVAQADSHRPELVALAAWYALRATGQTKLAGPYLATQARLAAKQGE
jgi:hypothetical protein